MCVDKKISALAWPFLVCTGFEIRGGNIVPTHAAPIRLDHIIRNSGSYFNESRVANRNAWRVIRDGIYSRWAEMFQHAGEPRIRHVKSPDPDGENEDSVMEQEIVDHLSSVDGEQGRRSSAADSVSLTAAGANVPSLCLSILQVWSASRRV